MGLKKEEQKISKLSKSLFKSLGLNKITNFKLCKVKKGSVYYDAVIRVGGTQRDTVFMIFPNETQEKTFKIIGGE